MGKRLSIVQNLLRDPSFSGHNYLDMQAGALTRSGSTVSMRSLPDAFEGVLFISSDGTHHVYGNSPKKAIALLVEPLKSEPILSGDKMLFVNREIYIELTKNYPELQVHHSFEYQSIGMNMIFDEQMAAPISNLRVRKLTDDRSSQKILIHWFDMFNKEQGSGWTPPKISETDDQFFVFENKSNEIVGAYARVMTTSKQRFWFGRMFVFPKYRGNGYSREIVADVLHRAFRLNLSPALLVNSDNHVAKNVYSKSGFQVLGDIVILKYGSSKD